MFWSEGHSGKASAQYCSLELKSKIEGTSHWKEYHKLNEIDRRKQTDLISKALVAAFEKMDEELLMLDTSGLLVRDLTFRCLLMIIFNTSIY